MDDLDEVGTPNCPRCLEPMEVVGDFRDPRWECPSCGPNLRPVEVS